MRELKSLLKGETTWENVKAAEERLRILESF